MDNRVGRLLALLIVPVVLAGTPATAENIDPANNGSQYAWAENLGWLNLQPNGPGADGVQVTDSALTGWAWAENAGWISLSCQNTSSCGVNAYGVTNNGCGTLGGFAWSENEGWINFAPTGAGIVVDPDGIFCGRAWSENAGWITFASAGPYPFRVATSWRGTGLPAAVTGLHVSKAAGNNVALSWSSLPGATSFDVIQGALVALRGAAGNFEAATQSCVVDNTVGTSFTTTTGGTPSPGDGFWYLVRGAAGSCNGTYDTGTPRQAGPNNCEIAVSGNGCL